MARNERLEKALELFLEAAIAPSLVPSALDAFARSVNSRGAMLATPMLTPEMMPISPGLQESSHAFFEEGWHRDAIRTKRGAAMLAGGQVGSGFVSDHDLFSSAELQRLPYYRLFAEKQDVPYFSAAMLIDTPGQYVAISLNRRKREGAFTADQKLHMNAALPRLRQAASLGARFFSLHAAGMLDSFELIGTPAFLLSPTGHICGANHLAMAIPNGTLSLRRGSLQVADRDTQRKIDQLLRSLVSYDHSAQEISARPVVVQDPSATAMLILQGIPLRGVAHDVFRHAAAIILVTNQKLKKAPTEAVLSAAFDFTPAEARVARLLLDGSSVEETSAALKLTRETVRFYTKSILSKSNTHRQSDFIRFASQLVTLPQA